MTRQILNKGIWIYKLNHNTILPMLAKLKGINFINRNILGHLNYYKIDQTSVIFSG